MYWRRGYGSYDYGFPPAAPRPQAVAGKARKKFGMTWWGQQWVEAVERKGDENRMSRGRAYARAEKAHGIDVKPGSIRAKVEGSYGTYSVSIQIKKFSPQEWDFIIRNIRSSPALGVLLNNEMPEKMDSIALESCNDSFIPNSFRSRCSCPDYANPCKHIAAVYYTLADEIDRAPQILFALRGMEPQELFARLSGEIPTGQKKEKQSKAMPTAKKGGKSWKTKPKKGKQAKLHPAVKKGKKSPHALPKKRRISAKERERSSLKGFFFPRQPKAG